MTSVGGKADIEALLERIGETGELPEPYAADPGSLFLAIHRQWVENGGTVAGKRRHSIRTLEELVESRRDSGRFAAVEVEWRDASENR